MRVSPSGGMYIGRTIQKESIRWRNHCIEAYNTKDSNYNCILNHAIRKYGGENFTVKILESGIPDELLDERESYWIEHYKTYYRDNPKGYNMTRGGDGRQKIEVEKALEYWNEWLTIKEVAAKCNVSYPTAQRTLRSNDVDRKDSVRRAIDKRTSEYYENLKGETEIYYKLWLEGKTITEIHNITGKKGATISDYLNRFYNVTPEEIRERKIKNAWKNASKTLLQFALDGTLIQEWPNVKIASKELDISMGHLYHAARQGVEYKNFIWEYKGKSQKECNSCL